jgi:hypothetical protein
MTKRATDAADLELAPCPPSTKRGRRDALALPTYLTFARAALGDELAAKIPFAHLNRHPELEQLLAGLHTPLQKERAREDLRTEIGRICKCCREDKGATEFNVLRVYNGIPQLDSYCRPCRYEQNKIHAASVQGYLRVKVGNSRVSDKRSGRDNDIDVEFIKWLFIIQEGLCYLSNAPLSLSRRTPCSSGA